jgi:ubiquinone/menaquinone biosynthesis C-methylase UbiE
MKNQEKKRQQFQLFQTPLDLAHTYWHQLLKPGNWVIDATCGNGHDTLFLAQTVLDGSIKGRVIAMDSQLAAIESTQKLLETSLPKDFLNAISLHHQCHSSFPSIF